jgi:hypothetical protein
MRQSEKGLTRAELLALPAAVDVQTACRALNMGKTVGYELAQRGEFPVPVLRVGNRYRVPTSHLLALLGVVQDRGADGELEAAI